MYVLHAKLFQSCLIPCNRMDWSPEGSSVHGILQARIPCPPPRNFPGPVIKPTTLISPALAGGFSTASATWEDCIDNYISQNEKDKKTKAGTQNIHLKEI